MDIISSQLGKVAILLGLGAMTFSFIEGLSLLDGLYFANQIVTSIGAGDVLPQTKAGKVATVVYALMSMGLFGEYLSSASSSPWIANHLLLHFTASLTMAFLLFYFTENWAVESVLDTYFMTSTTIGIGSMPQSLLGRLGYTLWSLYSIPVVAAIIARVKDVLVEAMTVKSAEPSSSSSSPPPPPRPIAPKATGRRSEGSETTSERKERVGVSRARSSSRGRGGKRNKNE